MRRLKLVLLIFAFENALQTDARLDIYYVDLAVGGGYVSLAMALILPD